MPNWKFWDKPRSGLPPAETQTTERQRFGLRPRTDLPGFGKPIPPEKVEQLDRLRRRRETVMFDVEQAELATFPENPWRDRISLQDEALVAVRSEIERTKSEVEQPGVPFQAIPIESLTAFEGPPLSVTFRIGGEQFGYEEDQDWAERGFQLARGELHLVSGDPAKILKTEQPAGTDAARLEHLTSSLFVLASDIRDRSLEGRPLPVSVTVADLAKPDTENGGWLDWKGHSPAKARKEARLHELHVEGQRLLDNRARELDDLAKWEDRLPIALRLLADVDAEIEALGG